MKVPALINIIRYIDKKTLRNSAILLGLIILFIMICLMPAVKSNKELRQKCIDVENNIIRTVRKIDDYPQLKKEKEETEAYVATYFGQLLEEREKTRLIGDVSDIAKQCKVKIISMQPRSFNRLLPEDFLAYIKPLSYELTLECGYHQFGSFINKLENFNIVLHVEEFHIDPNAETETIHSIRLILSTYAKI